MYFLQMSGFPGSGKSTLAREIAKHTGAIIVDHDIVKTSLLKSLEGTVTGSNLAGAISYNIDWSLVEFHLSLGHSVIFDSPCLYDVMIEKGTELAEKYHSKYKYVECYINDRNEINKRLRTRERMLSQISEIASEDAFQYTIHNSKKPYGKKTLTMDSSQPLESYLQQVLDYVNE